MFGAIAKALFGSQNDRLLKRYAGPVAQVAALEPELEALSDADLRARTDQFRERLQNGEALDGIMVEAFATVREAARRTLGQRHFDVQMIGGMVLHEGKISEMKTGEGKTLVATLPVYLNALEGNGVHVVTVNDYLAQRDSVWMGRVYEFLGLTVGCIVHEMTDDERRAAYACDVTYGTNNEFGFDYLRDNMKFRLEDMVQRTFNFAIVDEVDSILVDEARTPLVISGPADDSSDLYTKVDKIMPSLAETDYEKDEKQRSVALTDDGAETIERLLSEAGILEEGGLYDFQNVSLVHHVNQALKAHKLFTRDKDYMIKDDKVVIIDEFTGRAMEGRRYSEGLHQALEAKERVTIQNENQTLASITFQNYFRLYPKLAGMTGTALTEAAEFAEIYNLEVVEIPTNVTIQRKDEDDEVYRSAREKYDAVIMQIEECRERGQPVLVGTASIEKSELVASLLKKKKIPHQVLNARFHEQEAGIIAKAGVPGAVTIATNMAGRGTDIQLGGNVDMEVLKATEGTDDPTERDAISERIHGEIQETKDKALGAGGLYVISTERHESRRIDNQLRGRSGRQGDPGASKFFLSLEDDLMRIFGSERMDGMLQKLGLQDGEAIVHPWINKALEKAQQKVEARNFEIRKQLLKYDDVMNDQRKVVYEQRREIMSAEDVQEDVNDMRQQVIEDMVAARMPEGSYPEQWELEGLHQDCLRFLALDLPIKDWAAEEGIADREMLERIRDHSNRAMAAKAVRYGRDVMRMAEKSLLLQILDQQWKDHLLSLDHLRQGINLRAYGQKDPLNEYKREAFSLFESMLDDLRRVVTSVLSHLEIQVRAPEELEARMAAERAGMEMSESRADPAMASAPAQAAVEQREPAMAGAGAEVEAPVTPVVSRAPSPALDPDDPSTWGKVPRNAPCPCGSGKKYKHCHGLLG